MNYYEKMLRDKVCVVTPSFDISKKDELVNTFSKLLEEALTDSYNSGYQAGLRDGNISQLIQSPTILRQ